MDLSPGAKQLIKWAYANRKGQIIDYHTHLLYGDPSTYLANTWNPYKWVKLYAILKASGVNPKTNQPLTQYLTQLLHLIGTRSHHYLYAMDGHPHIPNNLVWNICQLYPHIFTPVMSIHPYRKNAIQILNHWIKKGVKFIKWLPNTMKINPSSPKCIPFYKQMSTHNITLITHTGCEYAIDNSDQSLGNPLLLKLPLSMGIKVVAAHCGMDGYSIDTENPDLPIVDNFSLWLRLMHRYQNLFGDLSATLGFTRQGNLKRLLQEKTLHSRIINGSDYPIIGLGPIMSTTFMVYNGLIKWSDKWILDEIYSHNPLIFDHVAKRLMGFPIEVFMENKKLGSKVRLN